MKMIRYIVIFSLIAIVIAVAAIYTFLPAKEEAISCYEIKNKWEWEQMRLRDPKTGQIPKNIHRAEQDFAKSLPGSLSTLDAKSIRLQATQWTQRGPFNIGGRTRAFAVDLNDQTEKTMLAGGVSGGIWRSIDGGDNWVKISRPDQLQSVSCIAQDSRPGKSNIWYYGTGEFWGNSADISGDGIYKSTDNGLTWNPLTSTQTNNPQSWDQAFDYVWNIALDHTNTQQDVIYSATTVGGIYRSSDGGKTWNTVLGGFGNSYSFFTDVAISPKGVLYATLSQITFQSKTSAVKGIYRSIDGINWTNITPAGFPAKYNRVVIGIAPSDENQVYFLGETPGFGQLTFNSMGDSLWHSIWKYTFVSGDGTGAGGNWEDRSSNIPKPSYVRGHFNSQGGYDLIIRVKPDNPDYVILGGTSVYRSDNGFSTSDHTAWIGGYNPAQGNPDDYRYPNHHPDIHSLFFSKNDVKKMYCGSDGGVSVTNDYTAPTVEWKSFNNGYFTTQFYSIAIDHSLRNSPEIIGGLQDNSTLYNNSTSVTNPWTIQTWGDGFCSAIADSAGFYYSSQNSNWQPKIKVFRLKIDQNGNRTHRTRIDPAGGKDFIWNTPFKLDPNNSNVMYLAGGQILWRNNDLSSYPLVADSKDSVTANWDSLSFTRLSGTEKITAVEISKQQGNIVFYGTSLGHVYRIDNAGTGDPKPKEITGSTMPVNGYVGCIAADPHNANHIIVSFTNYNVQSIYSTTDGGQSWESIGGNLEQNPDGTGSGPSVNWIKILPIKGKNVYYAGTSIGLFSTAFIDGQFTCWSQEGAATIGNMVVDMIDCRESDGYVVVGTHGGGVYSSYVTELPASPAKPQLAAPADAKKGIPTRQLFTWNSVDDAVYYTVEFSKSADFSNIDFIREGQKTTSAEITGFEPGLVKYYWRVKAKNSGGWSNYSDVWSFTTVVAPPDLLLPDNKATELDIPVQFKWKAVNGASSYRLQISSSLLFTNILFDTAGLVTSELSVSKLDFNKRYYWRVQASNADGTGDYSLKWQYNTKTGSSVADELSLKGSVYPNPADDYINIPIILNTPANLSVSVFDATGKKVADLYNAYHNIGDTYIRCYVGNLRAGSYVLQINNGKQSVYSKLNVTR